MKELDIANAKADRLRDTLQEVEKILSMRVNTSEGGKRIAQYLWDFEDVCRQTASKESLRNLIAGCGKKGYISPVVAEGMLKCLDAKEKPPESGSETPAFDAAIRFAQAMFKAPD